MDAWEWAHTGHLTEVSEEMSRAIAKLGDLDHMLATRREDAASLRKELLAGRTEFRMARQEARVFHEELAMANDQLRETLQLLRELRSEAPHLFETLAPLSRHACSNGDLSARLAKLSRRERQVMDRIVAGEMNKNISADFGISQRTVEHYRQSLMRKMGVTSVAMLVQLAAPTSASPTTHAPPGNSNGVGANGSATR